MTYNNMTYNNMTGMRYGDVYIILEGVSYCNSWYKSLLHVAHASSWCNKTGKFNGSASAYATPH